jgi:uncharacterized protein (TIGR02118 family)
MVKLLFLLKRASHLSPDQFHRYWQEMHAPLVDGIEEISRHMRKYVQNHVVASFGDASEPPYDGVLEVWFDDLETLRDVLEERRYAELVAPDEKRFIDVAATIGLVVTEQMMWEGR